MPDTDDGEGEYPSVSQSVGAYDLWLKISWMVAGSWMIGQTADPHDIWGTPGQRCGGSTTPPRLKVLVLVPAHPPAIAAMIATSSPLCNSTDV